MSKSKAVLFGLNYAYDSSLRLAGCINDVKNTAQYLRSIGLQDCETITDDTNRVGTTAQGIMTRLTRLAAESYRNNLDFVWIHFSGHGTFVPDRSRDEKDGRDECIVPSDVFTRGVISDDMINSIISRFNPRTRIICIFDCCHSGSICDLKFSWEGARSQTVENARCIARGRVVSISGFLYHQYYADTWDSARRMMAGAMTSELLNTLQSDSYIGLIRPARKTVFELIAETRRRLRQKGYQQVPKLASNYDLSRAPFL